MKRQLYTGLMAVLIVGVLASISLAAAEPAVYRTGGLVPSSPEIRSDVVVEVLTGEFRFIVDDERAVTFRLRVLDGNGQPIHDSGLTGRGELSWYSPAAGAERFYYELAAWDQNSEFVGGQTGILDLTRENAPGPVVIPLAFDVTGNFTISGNLGVGLGSPERAVHIRGGNAVFRMDRSANTAAFMIVRIDASNNVLKSYVVGVNATGANNGTFVINDLGTATTGAGTNRLTIANDGTATFGGEVHATAFVTPSALALKTDICPLEGALGLIEQLRGVRFNWKDTGLPSIGFIADEVAGVVPEIVAVDAEGKPAGIDYGKLTAVLVEAAKTQQRQIEALSAECDQLAAEWAAELRAIKEKMKQ